MSVLKLSEDVANALERLSVVKEMPPSPARDEELPALNRELRKFRKRLWDQMNGLRWGKERKMLQGLHEKVDKALSNWEYEVEVDVSDKRLKDAEKELLAGGLNDSKRKKLHKKQRTILALREKSTEQARTAATGKSTAPNRCRFPLALRQRAVKAQKIAEYEASLAQALRCRREER